jgi:hypothetical protein
MKTDEHIFKDGECINCCIMEEYADGEPCEEEDLSIWCAPNQKPLDAIRQAADRDK